MSAAGARFRSIHERRLAQMRNSGMSVLLVLLVAAIFIAPVVIPYGELFRVFADTTMTLILISGVVAVSEHRRFAVALIVVSALVIIFRWSEWIAPASVGPELRQVSSLIALLVLAVAVGLNVFGSGHAMSDRIFGGIVLYLLIGLMFAVGYEVVDRRVADAFAGRSAHHEEVAQWVYFSFVTLTTVGYGDITPIARAARSMAILEALIGQLYPAIIIARLVSLQDTTQTRT
jgi:hypothetical protein